MCDHENDGDLPCNVRCRLTGLLLTELTAAWDAARAAGADPADLCTIVTHRIRVLDDDGR